MRRDDRAIWPSEDLVRDRTVLIVDDQEPNRALLRDFVGAAGLAFCEAGTGCEALEVMRAHSVDLVLLDIMMPELDGHGVLEAMKADETLRHLPVIVISGVDDIDSITRCLKRGADDYLTKPFNPTLLMARISACLERKSFGDAEREYRCRIETNNAELEERVRETVRDVTEAQLATIFAMSKLSESRDPETGEHLERMREYVRIVAERLRQLPRYAEEISDEWIENLYAAAPLHDIGKVGIPDQILQKPARLTPDEFEVMKLHAEFGAKTLRAVNRRGKGSEFVRMGIDIAQSHHEKWDGSGYPEGLQGEAIPLAARIMALADVYDALTSKRCYKEAFSHEKSRSIIMEGAGKHFDPEVVEAFLAEEQAFIGVRERYQDSEKVLLAAVDAAQRSAV
jgi:putative two-component system response regulator